MYDIPVWADSFITVPNLPVKTTCPFPFKTLTSAVKVSPPTAVHARPVTIPTSGLVPANWCLYLFLPKYSSKSALVITTPSKEGFSTYFLATFLHILPIVLSKFLTPASLVYESIISLITSSSIFIKSASKACSFNCFGSKYFLTIFSFSSSIYPDTSIISILSNSGLGIVLKLFAVVTNNILDKSKGTST